MSGLLRRGVPTVKNSNLQRRVRRLRNTETFRALLVESVALPAVALYEAQVDGDFSSLGSRGVSLDPNGSVHARRPRKNVSKGGQ